MTPRGVRRVPRVHSAIAHSTAFSTPPKADSGTRETNLAESTDEIRWDEKAGLPTGCCTLPSYRRALSTKDKETGNEEAYHRCNEWDGEITKTHDRPGFGRSRESVRCSG